MMLTMEQDETIAGHIEVEILPGKSVYLLNNGQATFCPWEKLTQDQKAPFVLAHSELAQAVDRIKWLFGGLPQPGPGEEW